MQKVFAAVIVLSGAFTALAARADAVFPEGCIATGGIQRVAAIAAPCCGGQMRCSQFLSTNRVVKPAHNQRT